MTPSQKNNQNRRPPARQPGQRPPAQNRNAAPERTAAKQKRSAPPATPLQRNLRLLKRFLRKKLAALPYLLPEGETVAKGAVCGGLILLFAVLQTTLFARFCPFGAIPDLMLPLVIAIAMTEGEKWGAVCGIVSAFVIEAIGSSGAALLPLLYAAAGYFCPIITAQYLTDSLPVRALYTAASGIGRSLTTLIYLALYVTDFRLGYLLGTVILPEYAASLCLAILPHLTVRLCLHPFHRSRAERTGSL